MAETCFALLIRTQHSISLLVYKSKEILLDLSFLKESLCPSARKRIYWRPYYPCSGTGHSCKTESFNIKLKMWRLKKALNPPGSSVLLNWLVAVLWYACNYQGLVSLIFCFLTFSFVCSNYSQFSPKWPKNLYNYTWKSKERNRSWCGGQVYTKSTKAKTYNLS